MDYQLRAKSPELIVANAIEQVVAELRLIDVADYIAFIRKEHFGSLSDLVDSAAELFFVPGALKLGNGEAHIDWSGSPRVVLDLELRPPGLTIYFRLTLSECGHSIVVDYLSFDQPGKNPEQNIALLEAVVERIRIRGERMFVH